MNKKSTLFVLITLAVAVAAVYISHSRAPETEVGTPQLFPALAGEVNDVVQVEVKSRLNNVDLMKDGDGWVIANRDKYPASFEQVKGAILDLSDMKIIEAKTSKPELYSRLDVQDVDADKSGSTQVTLKDRTGKVLASLIIGKSREGHPSPLGALRYVRRAGEAQSYLVAGELNVNADPLSWTNREIADISGSRIRSVRLEQPGQTPVEIDRDQPSDVNFNLKDVPDGYQPKSTAMLTSLSTALEQLRFNDVRAKAALKWPDDSDVATLRGFDGLVATIRTATIDGRQYSTLAFSFDPAGVEKAAPNDKAKAADQGNDKDKKDEKKPVPEEVKALNAKLGNWAYVLPDFKLKMLTTTRDSLLTKKQAPKPPVAEPPPPKDPLKVEHFDKNGHLIPNPPSPTAPAH